MREAIGTELSDELLGAHRSDGADGHDLSPRAKGIRRLRTVALGLLAAGDARQGAALAKAQFDGADNMTDRQGALGILVSLDVPERQAALDAFYARFHDDPLVLDKWFALQAAAQRPDTLDRLFILPGTRTSRFPTPTACALWPARSPAITGHSIRPTAAATPSLPT